MVEFDCVRVRILAVLSVNFAFALQICYAMRSERPTCTKPGATPQGMMSWMSAPRRGQQQGKHWYTMLLLFQSATYILLIPQGVASSSLALGLVQVGLSDRGSACGNIEKFRVCIVNLLRRSGVRADIKWPLQHPRCYFKQFFRIAAVLCI